MIGCLNQTKSYIEIKNVCKQYDQTTGQSSRDVLNKYLQTKHRIIDHNLDWENDRSSQTDYIARGKQLFIKNMLVRSRDIVCLS